MKGEVKSGGPAPYRPALYRWLVWAWSILLAVSLSPPLHASEIIALGQRNWDGSRAITQVLKALIETRLGHHVRVVESDDAGIFAAMHEGKGVIDVLTDLWRQNQADQWDKYIEGHKSVVVNDKPYIGKQGLFIPGYLQDQHQLRSVDDLSNPGIANLFDSDGDGKGEYWPGAYGWSSTHVEQVKAKSYGYDQYFKPDIVSDRALKAKLKTAFEEKRGILFYYWSPEWIHTAYDLRQLEEPPFDDRKPGEPSHQTADCWQMIFPRESADWLEKSRVSCAWPDTKVYVAFSASLFKRAPKVAQFLRQVAFTRKMLNAWLFQIGRNGRDPVVVAEDWIKAHPDIVETWLAGIPR